jgi:transposase, IS30 family
MTTNYSHLDQGQRYKIAALLNAGKSRAEIALALGCHKSTIGRELARNTPKRGTGAKCYKAERAQEKTQQRHRLKAKHCVFTDGMKDQIVKWLTIEKLSPELISVKGRQGSNRFVSHETIYTWIWGAKHSNRKEDRPYRKLYLKLKHGHRRRKRGNYNENRGCIPDRVPIEKRPSIVEKRKRIGDAEVDLVLGKNHQPGLLVITDRATLKTSLTKITTKASAGIARKIIGKMKPFGHWIKTFTYDNDMAFSQHQKINESLKTKSFFTRPYTSQDKGTVENRIGVIRRFFPKKTDFTKITARQVKRVEKMINERPVRKFKYQTPNQVLAKKIKRRGLGTKTSSH